MNENEKAIAVQTLAASIRETGPYLFQLSARHEEEVRLISQLAAATGSSASLIIRDRETGERQIVGIADYNPRKMVITRIRISDPLCLSLEDAGVQIMEERARA